MNTEPLPTMNSNAYCALCQVMLPNVAWELDKHLNGKNHKRKLTKNQGRSTISRAFERKLLYCNLCQVSCSGQKDLDMHLAGIKHKYKANAEKKKAEGNKFPKGTTMFIEGFKHDTGIPRLVRFFGPQQTALLEKPH